MAWGIRRRFFFAAGAARLLGAGAAGWLGARDGNAADDPRDPNHPTPAGLEPAVCESTAFGTKVRVSVLHADAPLARRAAAAAVAELEAVDRLLSLYRPDSPLSRLNREGSLDDPPAELTTVLRYAAEVSAATGGAFDVTVQPLWNVYAQAHRAGVAPEAADVRRAAARVDWRRVSVAANRIELTAPGVELTLNGIAQGYAADRAMAALRRLGVRHALVDAGEIAALGDRSGRPWNVGIRHPRKADAHLAVAALDGRCLATSGDYATAFDPEFRTHHIFDPRTGRSPTTLSSVSIAAPTAAQADAWATAVMVLGPEDGLQLARRVPGVDALLVLKNGTLLATDRFPVPNKPA